MKWKFNQFDETHETRITPSRNHLGIKYSFLLHSLISLFLTEIRNNLINFQLQNVVPLCILWYFGPEKLREVAHDYRMHVNEYHREMYFESFVEYLEKRKINCLLLVEIIENSHWFTDPDTFIKGTIIYVSIYAATAFIEMVGAYRVSFQSIYVQVVSFFNQALFCSWTNGCSFRSSSWKRFDWFFYLLHSASSWLSLRRKSIWAF